MLTTRSLSAGTSVQGIVCSLPGGTITTGPLPRCRAAGPSSASWSLGPVAFKMASALSRSSVGRLRASRRRARRGEAPSPAVAPGRPPGRRRPSPPPATPTRTNPATRAADQHVYNGVDLDDLDELGGVKLVQQVGDADRGPGGGAGATGPQRTGPHQALQPFLLPLERRGRGANALCLLQALGHLAQGG